MCLCVYHRPVTEGSDQSGDKSGKKRVEEMKGRQKQTEREEMEKQGLRERTDSSKERERMRGRWTKRERGRRRKGEAALVFVR